MTLLVDSPIILERIEVYVWEVLVSLGSQFGVYKGEELEFLASLAYGDYARIYR